MEQDLLLPLLVSVAFWAVVSRYCHRRYSAEFTPEGASRVVSIVHAILSTLGCGYALYADPHWKRSSAATYPGQLAMLISIGYFIVDLHGILTGPYFDVVFLFHHLACLSGLGLATFFDFSGYELVACTFICEVSNPPLHVRWIMVQTGRTTGPLYRLFNFASMVTFFLARVVIGPFLTIETALSTDNLLFLRLVALALQIVSLYFAWVMVSGWWKGVVWQV